ncbi:MAG: hypothetical protein LIP77_00650 [Planctomycetes bacterium]|nr:hypothetical protein [Planctomycetota bacterium]
MRKTVFYGVAIACLLACSSFAGEKVWPKGTPTVFVGFGAGGGTDTAIRPLIVKMQEHIGETINVVNMPGASSAVAAAHVMNQPNDGYSIFGTGTGCYAGFVVNETAPEAAPWAWEFFLPFQGPAAMVVNPEKSGINSVEDAIKALKDGTASVGLSGFGAGIHIIAEAFADIADVGNVNYVTFDSCRSTTVGVMAGEVEIGFITFSAGIDFAKSGDVTVLFLNQATPMQLSDTVTAPSIVDAFPAGKDLAHAGRSLGPAHSPRCAAGNHRKTAGSVPVGLPAG